MIVSQYVLYILVKNIIHKYWKYHYSHNKYNQYFLRSNTNVDISMLNTSIKYWLVLILSQYNVLYIGIWNIIRFNIVFISIFLSTLFIFHLIYQIFVIWFYEKYIIFDCQYIENIEKISVGQPLSRLSYGQVCFKTQPRHQHSQVLTRYSLNAAWFISRTSKYF